MDGSQFDQLSRRLAGYRTRRQAVKAIAGAVVATVASSRAAGAQSCAAAHGTCQSDDQCCAGAVCQYGLCMPGCRIDGTFVNAWTSPPGDLCNQCLPEVSTTGWTPANEGMSCWSGDPNAGATFCQSGECRATGPAECPPPPPCYSGELIDLATCTYAAAEAGTACGGQATCVGEFYQPADACDGNGFCIGGGSQTTPCAPYQCGDGACTTSCQSDDDCAGGAHCDDNACFTDEDLGAPCDEDGDCRSGLCVEGVCCNQRCEGLCDVCSAETGGYCSPVVCADDGLSCTSGICDDETGQCGHVRQPDTCLIEGVCYDDQAIHPVNACLECDPDANDWGAVTCPNDWPACTTVTCDTTSGCGVSINAGACLIDDACFSAGDENPANACQVCDPAVDQEQWSELSCPDDGPACSSATCDPAAGCGVTADAGYCLIDGACVADGTINPNSACQLCNAAANNTEWSWLSCPAGSGCLSGVCTADIQGEITEDQTQFGACVGGSTGQSFRTVSHSFTHGGGALRLGARAAGSGNGTLHNPFLELYTTYNPANPCDGRIARDDNSGCNLDSYLDLPDLAAGTYIAVVSGANASMLGSYKLTFGQGPAC